MKDDEATTVQLKKSVVKELKEIRKYPRETYNETILNLIKIAKEAKNTISCLFLIFVKWRREGDLNPRGPERPQAIRYT